MSYLFTLSSWPLFAQQTLMARTQFLESGGSTLSWVSGIALLGLFLGLLVAPSFEVKLNKRTVSAALTSGFLLCVSLVFSHALTYTGGFTDRETPMLLGSMGGISAGLGLFFLLVSCARFALSQAPPDAVPLDRTTPG